VYFILDRIQVFDLILDEINVCFILHSRIQVQKREEKKDDHYETHNENHPLIYFITNLVYFHKSKIQDELLISCNTFVILYVVK
jgi:hypothetical protein